jgi:hypothetical protein
MNRASSFPKHSVAVVLAFVLFAFGGLAVRAASLPKLSPLGPDLEGVWDGLLQMGSGTMPLSFAITTVDGKATVSVDILEQNARDIPVNAATRDGGKLHFDVNAIEGSFDGTLSPDGAGIQGTWTQVGKRVPLVLKRRTAE